MYLSLDIETLGLEPYFCDLIEVGAVLDDLKSPIEDLPRFHCYVAPDYGTYRGEPYAMAMHHVILKRIAVQEAGYRYLPKDVVAECMAEWLASLGVIHKRDSEGVPEVKAVVAGKNFGMFDQRFLDKLPGWGTKFKVKHRVIDPGSMFLDPKTMIAEDGWLTPPSLDDCLKLAGVEKSVSHTAVEDALDVIRCLRAKWGIAA